MNEIDEAICRHFKQPIDSEQYFNYWYQNIGFRLAMGKTWDEIRESYKECSGSLKIIAFLEENYTSSSWYEPR